MIGTKKIGIWMDHASARLMTFTNGAINTKTIESAFVHEDKTNIRHRSEKTMHNKEQHQESAYYNQLGEAISSYDDVLLFGPTDAKAELMNVLSANHRFDKLTVHVAKTDHQTVPQQQAFVTEYFANR